MNETRGTIVLVDDDDVFRRTATRALQRRGFRVFSAGCGEDALKLDELPECETAVVDLKMPGMDGLELLTHLLGLMPSMPVILLTGHGTISTAIDAIKRGAFHYLTKPCDIQELQLYLERGVERFRMQSENQQLRTAIQRNQSGHGILGESVVIRSLIDLIDRVKDSDAPVLVHGERGTGKERVARALHALGKRKNHPFVSFICTSTSPERIDRELFGESGSGGLVELAHQGTLLIDDIEAMPPDPQARLMERIEPEALSRDSATHRRMDTRIIAATHHDLKQEVAQGRFREDLFYRLNVLSITTPPLRDHAEDIPVLVNAFLSEFQTIRSGVSFDAAAMNVLKAYRWPGNVRELFNVCERALLLTDQDVIGEETIHGLLSGLSLPASTPGGDHSPSSQSLEDVEREHIRQTLESVQGNVSQAATVLKIDRRTLQRKMVRYGLREDLDN